LLETEHGVTALVREPKRAREQLGAAVDLCSADGSHAAWVAALSGTDAVVNLAGESVLSHNWTPARRRALASSRVELTSQLVAAIADATPAPRALLSASAVGYYGDRGADLLLENSPPGAGFLAQLCVEWENAALAATDLGVRVALLRIGIVLGSGGGALAAMLPAFRVGLGGPLGGGAQYVPFIHIDDLLSVIVHGLEDDRFQGPFNLCAPEPLTSREFAAALGGALHRPAVITAPTFALKLLLGARAEVVLQSQRTVPSALKRVGFRFQYPELPAALQAIDAV
jgi:uncharacterized protein (TIGR01777 family)